LHSFAYYELLELYAKKLVIRSFASATF